MATSIYKPAAAFVLISLLLLHLVEAADDPTVTVSYPQGPSTPSTSPKIDCESACSARCRLSSRIRLCKRACGTCCARCNCVPPGTSGNHEVCPCYAGLTTHGGRRKCP